MLKVNKDVTHYLDCMIFNFFLILFVIRSRNVGFLVIIFLPLVCLNFRE